MIKTKNERIFIADFIRAIAILFVVIIHCTCNYLRASFNTDSFTKVLIVDSIVSIAVPLFFMLCGCFSIKKENDLGKKNSTKIIKRLIQLLFWTLIYLLMQKYYLGYDINIGDLLFNSLFKSQISHLWFMYPLLSLYILSPIVSKLYYSLKNKHFVYLMCFTFIIPLIVKTFVQYFPNISIPLFAIGFSEFGYFILGKYIYDNINIIRKKINVYVLFSIVFIGLAMVVLYGVYDTNRFGITDNPFYDYSRFPVAFYCISFYCFILYIEKTILKLPNIIKNIITSIGSSSGGIYYIHMIFITIIPSVQLGIIGFTSNSGRLLYMLFGSVFYLIVSWLAVILLKKIPLVKEMLD